MDKKVIIITASSVLAFLMGFLAMAFVGISEGLIAFPLSTTAVLMTVIVFGFSFLLFGYPAPLIALLAGIQMGWGFTVTGMTFKIALASVSILLALFASSYMGMALLQDMTGKGNFKKSLKLSSAIMAVALVLAAVSDYLVVTQSI